MQISLKEGTGGAPDEIVFGTDVGVKPLYISAHYRATTTPGQGATVFDHSELTIARDGRTADFLGLRPGTIISQSVLDTIRDPAQRAINL